MNDERVAFLVDQYLDGLLTDEEAKELLNIFESMPHIKAWFVNEVSTSNLIYGLNSGDELKEKLVCDIRQACNIKDPELTVVEADSEDGNQRETIIQSTFRKRRLMKRLGIAACAALLLIAFGFQAFYLAPVATLTHSDNAIWDGESQLREGDSLRPGTLKLKSGVATLKFGDAVRVTLEGPAEYELIASDLTRLKSGSLNANVLADGIGFQVQTDSANVVDLGTTFSVTVDEKQETDVIVFEGKVDVENNTDHERKVIGEGLEVKLSRRSHGVEQFPLVEKAATQGWRQLFGVLRTEGNVHFMDARAIDSLAAFRDSDYILVIPEQVGKLVSDPVKATIIEPGFYEHSDRKERVETLDIKGERIDTYLIQFNPHRKQNSTEEGPGIFSGEVVFNRPILAIITRPNQLRATDNTLGKQRFDYDEGATSRGIETDDEIELGPDRKTLKMKWMVSKKAVTQVDQIRVLVKSD